MAPANGVRRRRLTIRLTFGARDLRPDPGGPRGDMTRGTHRGLVVAAGLLAAHTAHAAVADGSELDLFALDSQMDCSISSSTKTLERAADTPAVVTIVTADEIQARGYTSVAEV